MSLLMAAAFRAREAHDGEIRAWRVLDLGGYSKAARTGSTLDFYPGRKITAEATSFATHDFETAETAREFVRYRAFRAALLAALRFWEG